MGNEVNHADTMSEENQSSFAFELLKEQAKTIKWMKLTIIILIVVMTFSFWFQSERNNAMNQKWLNFFNEFTISTDSTITVDGGEGPAIYTEKGDVNLDGKGN